ncbi:hypothetical protein [Allokutzneria oryzae]|uniref:Transposase Helix-turn-helix domain-containing protein n=1 Tax=Allokutzneria oryzae TaxID=1378989 RepID=A0ABV6A0P4_9PSEU
MKAEQFGRWVGRPWRLALAERVLLVAVHQLAMRQLAPLFGVAPATVCRVIQRLGSPLALGPVAAPRDAVARLWIVAADTRLVVVARGGTTPVPWCARAS